MEKKGWKGGPHVPLSSSQFGPKRAVICGTRPAKIFRRSFLVLAGVERVWGSHDLMMAVLFIIPGFIPPTNTLLREVTSVVIPGYPRVRPSFRFGSLCPDFKRMMETRDLPIQTNKMCVCILFNQRRGKKAMDGSIKVARDFPNRRFTIAHSPSS